MKTRMMQAKQVKLPRNPAEWDSLAAKAVRVAELSGDLRAYSIKKSIQEGSSEKILRSYGVISEADITREFPVPD
jgi:hypothetical protein